MQPELKFEVVKVVIDGRTERIVTFGNKKGDREVFRFDGRLWHWVKTNHLVTPEMAKKLNKGLRKWQKKTNKTDGKPSKRE